MCGHFGIAGKITGEHDKLLKDMLVVDSLRGIDSVGLATVRHDMSTSVFKKAMLPHDFLTTRGLSQALAGSNKVQMGHNRWATRGGIYNNTAHPFDFDNVVGCHNGTLVRQHLLPNANDYDIDSENIFHSIDIDGIEATWERIDGAAALVYFDKEKGNLCFIRNKERPFFFTYSEDRKTLFWMSEKWMLEGLLARHGMEHTDIVDTAEDTLYSMQMSEIAYNNPLNKMHIRKLKAIYNPYAYEDYWTPNSSVNKLPITGDMATTRKKYPIGTRINISYTKGNPPTGTKFIDAFISGNAEQAVRVFVNSSSTHIFDALHDGCVKFSGKINGWLADGKLIMQANSVYAVKKEKPSAEDYVDFGGIAMNIKDFNALPNAAKDCAWCSSPIQFEIGNVLINNTTCVCPVCAEEEEVKEMFTNGELS